MSQPFIPRAWQVPIIGHQSEHDRQASWAGMGTGKTGATLTVQHNKQLIDARPFLVVAPLRVAQSTWPDEARKWDHLSSMELAPVIGSTQVRHNVLFKELKRGNAAGFTINYENLPWLMEALAEARAGWPFGEVIADESTKLKGFRLRQGTQRAKALGKIAHTKVDRWTNLTGTPAPNGLKDLWGQTWFLDQGLRLGRTHDAFTSRWFGPAKNGFGVVPFAHSDKEIYEKLRDVCLAVDIRDYVDIKEPIVCPRYVELPAKVRALYREMEKKMFMEVAGREIEAFNAGSRTQKCLQLCAGAVYTAPDATDDEHPCAEGWAEVHDLKMQALEEIFEEAAGMPVLVAYHFRSTKARLLKHFPKMRHLDDDPQTIRDWNAGKIPYLAAHPKSAGHGLNLQDGGNILAVVDHDWNLEDYDQIVERIGPTRQFQSGYNRPVWIYPIIARDTIDETVIERRASKRDVQELLKDAMKRRELGAEL